MDKYKANFEQGAEHYINLLEEINWFDNPYVNKEELIEQINESTYPPYFGTFLSQLGYLSEYGGEDQLNDVLNAVVQFIPNSDFAIEENGVLFRVNGNEYPIELNVEDFEVGEGQESFVETVINEILRRENSEYQFYELPHSDEASSLIFVKPEVYKKAVETGVIPDEMGYYLINDY